MTIQSFDSLTLARAVPDPKTIVSYGGTHVVYSEGDIDTPPTNPAEGEATVSIVPVVVVE